MGRRLTCTKILNELLLQKLALPSIKRSPSIAIGPSITKISVQLDQRPLSTT